jgi:hypothetical protein
MYTEGEASWLVHRKLHACGPILERRLYEVSTMSKDKACGAGSSDLRRLKRQFSSLKNTYILYDVKEGFIDGGYFKKHPITLTSSSRQWVEHMTYLQLWYGVIAGVREGGSGLELACMTSTENFLP